MSGEVTISSRPVRGANLWVRQSGDETVLVDGANDRVHMLNETALALWELCDGETTVEEMVTAASRLFDADRDQLQRDVLAALTSMEQRDILVVP